MGAAKTRGVPSKWGTGGQEQKPGSKSGVQCSGRRLGTRRDQRLTHRKTPEFHYLSMLLKEGIYVSLVKLRGNFKVAT